VAIVASGNVELNDAIILTGGVPAGEGGTVDVDADGDITQKGAITVAGRGTGGVGGEVRFQANGAITLGDVEVAGPTAGTLTTLSVAGTHLTGTLNADSTQQDIGTAGTIEVAACNLDMDSLAVISSAGLGGTNRVRSGGQMVLRGTLFAGESNLIEYQESTIAPVISGTVTPASTPAVNTGLGLCSIPGGGTTTTTLPGGCGTLADFDGLLCRLARDHVDARPDAGRRARGQEARQEDEEEGLAVDDPVRVGARRDQGEEAREEAEGRRQAARGLPQDRPQAAGEG
jgi:hypothetical protein